MLDLNKSVEIIKGAALNPDATWAEYKEADRKWPETVTVLAGPMIVAVAIVAPLLGWIFGTNILPGFGGFIVQIVMTLVWGLVGLALSGAIFGLLAGSFGGQNSFDNGFAAVSLAAVPAYAGQVLATIPWIGWLLGLALGIYSLVLLYRIQPVFLAVQSRVLHFVICLVLLIVIYAVLALPMASVLAPA